MQTNRASKVPLPSGLDATTVFKAYVGWDRERRNAKGGRSPKVVSLPPRLASLLRDGNKNALRRELDTTDLLEDLRDGDAGLHVALLSFVDQGPHGTQIRTIFAEALERRAGGGWSLLPDRLSEILLTHGDLKVKSQAEVEPGSLLHSILLFATAHALFQRSQRVPILKPLVELGPAPAAWLGAFARNAEIVSVPSHVVVAVDAGPPDVQERPIEEEPEASGQISANPENFGIATFPAAFDALRDSLARLHELSDKLTAKWTQRDMVEISLLAGERTQLERAAKREYEQLMVRSPDLDGEPVDLPPPKDWAEDRQACGQWLSRLADSYRARGEATAAAVATAREALVRQLQDLNIACPAELRVASTLTDVEAIRAALGSDITVAQAIRVSNGSARHAALANLDPHQRMQAFRMLALQNIPDVLEALVQDLDVQHNCRAEYVALAIEVVTQRVLASGSLPAGTWRSLVRTGGSPITLLPQLRDLLSRLPASADIDLPGLSVALSEDLSSLPKTIEVYVRLIRVAERPVVERIPTLAMAWRHLPDDQNVALQLLDALRAARRFKEAVYLASLAARKGLLVGEKAESLVRNLAMHAAIEALTESDYEILQYLTANVEWLVHDDEGAAVLLFLLHRPGLEDELVNLRYQHPARIESVRKRSPALAKALLPDENSRVRDDAGAHDALAALRDDLRKVSCYGSWPEARKYQVFFRKRLERLLLASSDLYVAPSPEDLVDEARAAGNLDEVQGAGRSAMLRFLGEQLERIDIVRATKRTVEDLSAPRVAHATLLRKEALKAVPESPLSRLYAILLERHL